MRTAGKATSLFFGRQYGDPAALTHGLSFFVSRDNPATLSVLFQDGIAVGFQHLQCLVKPFFLREDIIRIEG